MADHSDHCEDQLDARLDSALRAGLESGRVDVVALLDGSSRRARRVRSQRITTTLVAGALALAVPVGYEVAHPQPKVVVQPAAMMPSSSLTGPPPAAIAPTRTAAPLAPATPPEQTPVPVTRTVRAAPTQSLGPAAGSADAISSSLAFTAAELPAGLQPELDLKGPNQPTVNGQQCQELDATGARPVTGRQWSWVDDSGKLSSTQVNLIITGWSAGTGKQAFDDLVDDTGYCRWLDPQVTRAFKPPLSDQSWSATSTYMSLKYGRSAVRLGDVIAGVEVQDASGVDAAAGLAEKLATIISQRIQAAGLPAATAQ